MKPVDFGRGDFFVTEMLPIERDELLLIYDARFHPETLRIGGPDDNYSYIYTLNYLRLLLSRDRPEDRGRASGIISKFLSLQITEPP